MSSGQRELLHQNQMVLRVKARFPRTHKHRPKCGCCGEMAYKQKFITHTLVGEVIPQPGASVRKPATQDCHPYITHMWEGVVSQIFTIIT